MSLKRKLLFLFLTLLSFNAYAGRTESEAYALCMDTNSNMYLFEGCFSNGSYYYGYGGGVTASTIYFDADKACEFGLDKTTGDCKPPPPPPADCPSGTTDVNGSCQSDPLCPDGYQFTGVSSWNPSGCSSSDEGDDCSIGTVPDGDLCVPDGCLDGNYKNDLGMCVPITWDCPSGSYPQGNSCVAPPPPADGSDPSSSDFDLNGSDSGDSDPFDPDYDGFGTEDDWQDIDEPHICPEFFTYNGFKCVFDESDPDPECSDGFYYNEFNNACQPIRTPDSESKCQEGYSIDADGFCAPDLSITEFVECPAGTLYDAFKRSCELPVNCPSGTRLKDGLCTVIPALCDVGLDFINGTCQPASEVCGLNYNWNGSSCTPNTLTIDQECQRGSTLQNGLCVVDPIPCPAGYTKSGALCIEDLDPNNSTEIECPAGTVLSGVACITEQSSTCPPEYVKVGEGCELKKSFTDKGCGEEPICKGDPVQCAIARQGWISNCSVQRLTTKQVADSLGYFTTIATADISVTDLDTDGFDLPTSCPASKTYSVLGGSFVIDYSPFCSLAEIFGNLILITSGFISLRILSTAV